MKPIRFKILIVNQIIFISLIILLISSPVIQSFKLKSQQYPNIESEKNEDDDQDDIKIPLESTLDKKKEINFLQTSFEKKKKKKNNNLISSKPIAKPNETELNKYKNFRQNLENVLKAKNFQASKAERLAEKFKKFKYSFGKDDADDMITFYKYLKEAGERALKKYLGMNY